MVHTPPNLSSINFRYHTSKTKLIQMAMCHTKLSEGRRRFESSSGHFFFPFCSFRRFSRDGLFERRDEIGFECVDRRDLNTDRRDERQVHMSDPSLSCLRFPFWRDSAPILDPSMRRSTYATRNQFCSAIVTAQFVVPGPVV